MTFHLDKRGFLISLATDLRKVLDGWNTFFCVFELGSNPQCSTADKLVVLDINDTARDIAIHDVEGEIKSFRTEAKGEMDFHEKVHQAWTHVPSNLRLLIH